MSGLCGELWAAITALRPAMRARLGVPAGVDCGAARVRFERQTYVPDDDGIGALLFPCFDQPDPLVAELIDIVAWQPTDLRLASRCDIAGFLGWPEGALGEQRPLRLYRSPVAWAGDPDGIVVVDWRQAEFILLGRRPLIAEDVAHGGEIEKHLLRLQRRLTPKLPEIGVLAA